MDVKKDGKPQERSAHDSQQGKLPLEAQKIERAIKEINLARTNAGIYPLEHPQIAASLDRALNVLREITADHPALTLGIAQDSLLVEGERLNPDNPIFRRFAVAMNSRNILSLTFHRGLMRDDLLEFQRILNFSTADIRRAGGIGEMMKRAGLTAVSVQEVDYGRFHLTEEAEISSGAAQVGQLQTGDIWQDFIEHATGGRFGDAESWQALEDADPAKLSEFIEANPSAVDSVTDGFKEFLAKQRGRSMDIRTIQKLNGLLRSIRPELKQRLLAMTFDHMNEQPEAVWGGLGDDLILKMLEQADKENKTISPSLINLVQSLSGYGIVGGGGYAERSLEKFDRFFVQEKQSDYMDEKYSSTLSSLSEARVRDDAGLLEPDESSRPLEGARESDAGPERTALIFQIGEAFDNRRIVVRICRLLRAFLEQDLDAEDFGAFSGMIVEHAPDLLRAREFGLLLDILTMLRRQAREKPAPLSQIAENALHVFSDPAFVSPAIQAFVTPGGRKRDIGLLLLALGRPCVPGLMDIFVQEEFPSPDRSLMDLLDQFGAAAVDEARGRLDDHRPGTVRNLAAFLMKNGNSDCLPSLRPMLGHASDQVRLDVLAALLSLGDKKAPDFLRAAFHSKTAREAVGAISLAGRYRAAETAADLQKMIKRGAFLPAKTLRNTEIVRALGKIGDPSALPLLEKLARKRMPLRPGGFRNLKRAIFESLENYPVESRARLLGIGLRAKDARIRAICRSLQKCEPGPTKTEP